MEFTKNFIEQLKQSGKTQKQIAKELNISEGNITNWKNGKTPSLEIFYNLCKVLNADANELLGLKNL